MNKPTTTVSQKNGLERTRTTVLKQLSALKTMSLEELKTKWQELYGDEAPQYKTQFLIKKLAYRIQELYHGGLSTEAKNYISLRASSDPLATIQTKIPQARKVTEDLLPGTRFVRIWNDKRYEVIVREDGFEFEGKLYRSLSAIARDITGTRWNGKVFFGYKKQVGANV